MLSRVHVVAFAMRFRYRLINAEGTDFGPFVSKGWDWKPATGLAEAKERTC